MFWMFSFFFVIFFRLIIKGKLILSLLFANLLQMLTAGSSMTSKRWSSLALSKCVHLSRWTLGSAEQRRYKKHQIITHSHTLLILRSLSKKKKRQQTDVLEQLTRNETEEKMFLGEGRVTIFALASKYHIFIVRSFHFLIKEKRSTTNLSCRWKIPSTLLDQFLSVK